MTTRLAKLGRLRPALSEPEVHFSGFSSRITRLRGGQGPTGASFRRFSEEVQN